MKLLWTIAWKEWLGLRWKLAALTAIPVGFLLVMTAYDPSLMASSSVALVCGYGLIAPIFLAMHAAAEDQSAGTLEFVRGIPIPLAQLGLIRVLATLAALIVPLIVTAALTCGLVYASTVWNPNLHVDVLLNSAPYYPQVAAVTAVGIAVMTSAFLWTTALAMNQPSELRAGLVGIVTVVVWGTWSLLSVSLWDNAPGNWWMYAVTALGPFASLVAFDPGLTFAGRLALGIGQLAGLVLLVWIAARRYGSLEPRLWRNPIHFSNANRALWWMQWRQVWPLGAAGLASILALSALGLLQSNANSGAGFYLTLLYPYAVIIGNAWAIVIGATIFSADLEPKLFAFWRSRPIDPSAWFRIKYLAGALVIVAFIDLPAAWLGVPLQIEPLESIVAYLACVPAMHLAVYSLAVLTACLVRQTIYSGILALGATLFIVVMPMIVPKRGALASINIEVVMEGLGRSIREGRFHIWLFGLAVYLAFTLLVAIAATALAHWSIQKDLAVRA